MWKNGQLEEKLIHHPINLSAATKS